MRKLILIVVGIALWASARAYCATQFNAIGSVQMSTSSVNGGFGFLNTNKASLVSLVPAAAGNVVYCTDCTYGTLCVSTGTGAGAWISVSSGTPSTGSSCR